jgi:hypothetical protein
LTRGERGRDHRWMVVPALAMSLVLFEAPAGAGSAPAAEPDLLSEDNEHSARRDGRFDYRGTSLVFGARFATIGFACDTLYYGPCSLSPVIGSTTEIGWPRIRFAFDLHTAPAPLFEYDVLISNMLTASVGVAAGNESYRATLLVGAGFVWYGLELRALLAPWRGKNGGRHGIDIAVGWALFYIGTATVGYRWFPPIWNLRSRRRR